MAVHAETAWGDIPEITWAVVDIKHPIAVGAMKMMVVGAAGYFIPRAITRNRHGRDISGLEKRLHVAIDRRDTNATDLLVGRFQNFLG